jgi:hypothetical protein
MKAIRYPISESIRILSIVILISLAVALILTPALADPSAGSISGTVKDTAGNPLAHISIDAGDNAGDNGGASTDANGNYVIRGLPFGQYSIGSPSPGRWGSNDGVYVRQTKDTAISATSPDASGINFVLGNGGSNPTRPTLDRFIAIIAVLLGGLLLVFVGSRRKNNLN